VIRLWHRIGVFRIVSAGLLALGVVAAGYLGVDRQSQQRVNTAADSTVSVQDQQRELQVAMAERERASAASRNAQREAQAEADAAAVEAAASAKAAEEAARKKQPSTPTPSKAAPKPPPPFGPIPASCNGLTGNQAIGCTLMLEKGFGLDNWSCLQNLWNKESGWRVNAANGSGAYGIPQALPGYKMGVGWKTDPTAQINWGLTYIKGRYKTPCGAWSYWQAHKYY